MTAALPTRLPATLAVAAHQSVGAALAVAGHLAGAGQRLLGAAVHTAGSPAFIHGLSVGCLVAGGVAAAGAIMAAVLLPAQPSDSERVEPEAPIRAELAAATHAA